ncbi:MAG: pentapeptide repeat-containing protein [Gammaproteobacteria bacterium]|nr:pentapeptide repeat-containing protein [Gammaproteobacteria bacterium]
MTISRRSKGAKGWYCRMRGVVLGPFSPQQLIHYTILGRVSADDEISQDRQRWQCCSRVSWLQPEYYLDEKSPFSEDDHHFFQQSTRWVEVYGSQGDGWEGEAEIALDSGRQQRIRKQQWAGLLVVATIMGGIILFTRFLPEMKPEVRPQCSAAASPGVNWRNCRLGIVNLFGEDLTAANLHSTVIAGSNLRQAKLDGADLSYSDLRGSDLQGVSLVRGNLRGANLQQVLFADADLRGSDFSFADLRGADLGTAKLEGTIMSRALLSAAIWPGGVVCREGSEGVCLE